MRKGISVGLLTGMLLLIFSVGYISDHEVSAFSRDDYQEIVVEEGIVYENAIVYDGAGQGRF